eukprot:7384803-Prymnesium_polylepis.2
MAGTYSSSRSLASQSGCDVCPIGNACAVGASYPELCAAGRYGGSTGQIDRQCSGACLAGFYCQAGSISNTSEACRTQRVDSSPPRLVPDASTARAHIPGAPARPPSQSIPTWQPPDDLSLMSQRWVDSMSTPAVPAH